MQPDSSGNPVQTSSIGDKLKKGVTVQFKTLAADPSVKSVVTIAASVTLTEDVATVSLSPSPSPEPEPEPETTTTPVGGSRAATGEEEEWSDEALVQLALGGMFFVVVALGAGYICGQQKQKKKQQEQEHELDEEDDRFGIDGRRSDPFSDPESASQAYGADGLPHADEPSAPASSSRRHLPPPLSRVRAGINATIASGRMQSNVRRIASVASGGPLGSEQARVQFKQESLGLTLSSSRGRVDGVSYCMVESVVPNSEAAAIAQIGRGLLIKSINGESAGVSRNTFARQELSAARRALFHPNCSSILPAFVND